MSTLESIFWHVLGYASMPVILLTGFLIAAGVGCFLLEATGHGEDE
jgi:uncharacterized protein (TIGR02808 family)